MMHKFMRFISLALMAALLYSSPADAQKKQKDSRAQAAFEAGEYFEAIDLYKNAYNKVDKEKKTAIFYKIGECYRILGESRSAIMWYRKAVNKGLVRGRSIESVVAAIIYLISRKHQLPKTLEELEEASGIKKKDIGRSYRFVCRRLRIRMPVATPMDYVPRFASELGLSGETEAKAIEILKLAREKGVTSGRGPTGVAAAAIYLAGKITKDKQTQKGIASRLTGVTEVTIRNRYEEIARELGLDI